VVVALALGEGSVWTVNQYFSIDLVFGLAVACLITIMYSGGLARIRRVLASRVALKIGLFSYSIYLLHGPLIGLFHQDVFGPMHLTPLVTFGLMLALAIPTVLVLCYAFHLMFEAPFLRCRGIGAFREMPIIAQFLPSRGRLNVPTTSNPPATKAVAAPKITP
jgi:peptidoglycan/LPS O-acetylase OafA/YrhL